MHDNEIFDKWELLLPEKLQGGYLIFMLYSRIQNKELNEEFTTDDIRLQLDDIRTKHRLTSAPYSERIIKNLLHFFIRPVPGRYGRFRLTDHGSRLIELLLHKLHNPYKNYPLKESFEKYFVLRAGEIKSIHELETKFGRGFADGQKQIITDHLKALQDELTEAYNQLNFILYTENEDATTMVKNFAGFLKNLVSVQKTFLKPLPQKIIFTSKHNLTRTRNQMKRRKFWSSFKLIGASPPPSPMTLKYFSKLWTLGLPIFANKY